MGILSSYLMRSILISTMLVLLVLLALVGLFEFIKQLEDIQGNYELPQALLFDVTDCRVNRFTARTRQSCKQQ
jgi:lipopolysaccharide export LptBFGC system permease protein LptF